MLKAKKQRWKGKDMKRHGKILCVLLAVLLLVPVFAGCGGGAKDLKLADAGWDSNRVHNAIVGFIATSAYGYDSYTEITATSTVLHEGLLSGEVDVHTEVWTDNMATYQADVDAGKLAELGVNYDDNIQGIYVPRYVIEGDAARGIAPIAPDLKTVQDLKKYPELFPDDEIKGKGRIYGAIPGWEVDEIMYNKFLYYGLDESFNYFRAGSDAALAVAYTSAYDRGEPIVGYYWEPTWLMGKLDFVLLEDSPYTDSDSYKAGKTACPSVKITVAASNDFKESNPEFCEFLSKYHTSSALTSEALAHMQDTGDDTAATAKWFLKEHDDLIDQWLPADKAQLVRDALK